MEVPTRRDAPGHDGQGGEEGNQTYRKARIDYGHRWIAESVFSAFMHLFSERLMALKGGSILQEVRLKMALYNRWRNKSMVREAGDGTS